MVNDENLPNFGNGSSFGRISSKERKFEKTAFTRTEMNNRNVPIAPRAETPSIGRKQRLNES